MSRGASADVRVQRVLAMLPWIAERAPVSVDEIARRFDLPADHVHTDLSLLMCCGAGHRYGGDMVDVWLDDGAVHVDRREPLARPIRLNTSDGLRVLAVARTMLTVPGAHTAALASLVDKLAGVVGPDVEVDAEGAPHLALLQGAAGANRSVDVAYYSASSDEVTERRIDPELVHLTNGRWYVEAWDHLRSDRRRFRLSRILECRDTDATFERRPDAPSDASITYSPAPDSDRVVLDLAPAGRWVVESYPCEVEHESPEGRVTVALAISGRPWLERLLLRLGSDVSVVDPPGAADVGADVARRVLARYG
ncbi:MAG TPA: WYL domain-containing protein [Acidimicrobiales bacterium]